MWSMAAWSLPGEGISAKAAVGMPRSATKFFSTRRSCVVARMAGAGETGTRAAGQAGGWAGGPLALSIAEADRGGKLVRGVRASEKAQQDPCERPQTEAAVCARA